MSSHNDETEDLIAERDRKCADLDEALTWEQEYASQASRLHDEILEIDANLEGLGVDISELQPIPTLN